MSIPFKILSAHKNCGMECLYAYFSHSLYFIGLYYLQQDLFVFSKERFIKKKLL